MIDSTPSLVQLYSPLTSFLLCISADINQLDHRRENKRDETTTVDGELHLPELERVFSKERADHPVGGSKERAHSKEGCGRGTEESPGHSRYGAKTEERVKASCEALIRRILNFNEKPNNQKLYELQELRELCIRVREALLLEPPFVKITPPVYIFGDIHGQLPDLLAMMKTIGEPPKHRFLFLGDYVDRGQYSVEVISMLLAMKLRYPKHIWLLRGNHETRFINRQYGFFEECIRKFGQSRGVELWTLYQHVFNCLPVAGLVAHRIFCAHGGISEDLISFKQFSRIRRPTDITDLGMLTDILWSDPSPHTEKYALSPRGVSAIFGKEAVDSFCSTLNVDLIVRAHQCVMDGYEFFADKKCITIFSAPCYCGEVDNAAGVLYVGKTLQCQIYTYRNGLKPNQQDSSSMAQKNHPQNDTRAPATMIPASSSSS